MKIKYILLILFFLIWAAIVNAALMNSSNYQITSAVVSSGGTNISSSNYKTTSILATIAKNITSTSYKLFLGFWYTVTDTPPTTPTLSLPTDNDHTNDNTITFDWTDSIDVDNDAITYELLIDNETNFNSPYVFSNPTIPTSTYTLGTSEALADGTYYWKVKAVTSDANSSYTTYRTVVIDTINPGITWNYPLSDNSSTENDNSLALNITFSDLNLFKTLINITNSSGDSVYENSTEDVNSTSENHTEIIDTTNWNDDNYTIEASATDDHTKEKLQKLKAKIKDKTIGKKEKLKKVKDIETDSLSFGDDLINLAINTNLIVKTSVELVNDEYFKFGYRFTKPRDIDRLSFNLTATEKITYRKNSAFAGHFVYGDYYLDFQDVVDSGYKISVTKINDYNYQVDIDLSRERGLIDIDPVTGGLNTRTEYVKFLLDRVAPTVTLISPLNNSGDNDGTIVFSYNVSDVNNVTNCSLIINDAVNTVDKTITKDITQNFTVSLDTGSYNWSINCSDEANNIGESEERVIAIILMTDFNGDTTDISQVNVSNITNFILENIDYGKINFSTNVDLSAGADLNSYVDISFNRIELNSTAVSVLNESANLYLYDLTFSDPRPLRDGVVCPASICTEISYENWNFTFSVTEFTVYSTEETPTKAVAPSGVTAGGGVGISVKRVTDFTVSPSVIKSILTQGQLEGKELLIENTGTVDLDISIEQQNLDNFIAISEESFRLKAGDSKIVRIDVYAPDKQKAAVYTGKLIVKADGLEKIINVIIEVKEKEALFDIKVDLDEKFEKVFPGTEVEANIVLYNLGTLKPVDVELYYSIRDMEGNDIIYESETFAVYEQKLVKRKLRIPEELKSGYYLFYGRIIYGSATVAASSSLIEVVEREEKPAPKKLIWGILIFFILGAIVFGFIYRREIHEVLLFERRKERIKVIRLEKSLDQIADLIKLKEFTKVDSLHKKVKEGYLSWPKRLKIKHPGLKKKIIELEIKKKLEEEAKERRKERIKPPIVRIKPRKVKISKLDIERKKLLGKIKSWKNKGYDITLLEEELESLEKKLVVKKEKPYVEKLKEKIKEWKVKGYDTKLLEEELKNLEKRPVVKEKIYIKELGRKIKEWKAKGYDTKLLEKELESLKKRKD